MEITEAVPCIELAKPSADALESEFLPYFQSAFKSPPFLGEIYTWAASNVTLPSGYNPPGSYNVNLSPYFVDVFKAIKDPNIRQVNLMSPPRSGKTLVCEIVLLYLIANAPGNILWVQSTEAASKKMGDARMSKLLRLCPPVEKLIDKNDRHAIVQARYRFANGVEVHLANATIKSLQSFGYKYVVFDECWLSSDNMIAESKARLGDFPNTYKIILISQGGSMDRPEWEYEFQKAPIKEYGFNCPKCGQEQLYLFNTRLKDGTYGGLFWARNEKTRPNGIWNIEEACKDVSLKCINDRCKHCVYDPKELVKSSHYMTTKEKGDPSAISFRVNSLPIEKVSWSTLVREWLQADAIEKGTGDRLAKEQFYQKRLAQTWGTQVTLPIVNLRVFALPEDQEWQNDAVRCCTVDLQRKAPRFWIVVREWIKGGDSRKIFHGTAHTWEELDTIVQKYKVKPYRVLVDSGDGAFDDEIFVRCTIPPSAYWGVSGGRKTWLCYTATKGSGLRVFKEQGNRPFKMDFARTNVPQDPKYKGVLGCPYVIFSNFRTKTVLSHLIQGRGAKWLSNDNDAEYAKQMASEIVVKEKGIPRYVKADENAANEYYDCEVLSVLFAIASGILIVTDNDKGIKEDKEKPLIPSG